jgi:hydrogenase assembly chaperone HypC/HupF
VNRVVLVRRGGAVVEARECADDGTAAGAVSLRAGELAAFVADREREPVRWVWDDTTRWYPALLAAGVRVERCTDLRLGPAILRRSPFADRSLLDGDDAAGPGDWVLIHVGFALSKVDEEEATTTRRLLEAMGAEYEQELEELKASVIE